MIRFSLYGPPVQNLKLRIKRGIIIKICAPFQTDGILSKERQFLKNLGDFLARFNAVLDTMQQTKIVKSKCIITQDSYINR